MVNSSDLIFLMHVWELKFFQPIDKLAGGTVMGDLYGDGDTRFESVAACENSCSECSRSIHF